MRDGSLELATDVEPIGAGLPASDRDEVSLDRWTRVRNSTARLRLGRPCPAPHRSSAVATTRRAFAVRGDTG